MSYASAAAAAAPGKPVRGGVAALAAPPRVGPSATTRSVRQCSKQGTKLTRVIFWPHPIFAGVPPPVDAVFAALESFRPCLKAAKYTLRNDLVLTFESPVDPADWERLAGHLSSPAPSAFFLGGIGEVLNRGTSALLKFPLVPTHLPDSSAVTDDKLHEWITAHPKWADVKFIKKARFVVPVSKKLGLSATVLIEIQDGRSGSTARRLLQMDISFGGAVHRTRPWSIARPAPQCSICLKWVTPHTGASQKWPGAICAPGTTIHHLTMSL
jgi:hypothetical protein